jgi:hypothetical protein
MKCPPRPVAWHSRPATRATATPANAPGRPGRHPPRPRPHRSRIPRRSKGTLRRRRRRRLPRRCCARVMITVTRRRALGAPRGRWRCLSSAPLRLSSPSCHHLQAFRSPSPVARPEPLRPLLRNCFRMEQPKRESGLPPTRGATRLPPGRPPRRARALASRWKIQRVAQAQAQVHQSGRGCARCGSCGRHVFFECTRTYYYYYWFWSFPTPALSSRMLSCHLRQA